MKSRVSPAKGRIRPLSSAALEEAERGGADRDDAAPRRARGAETLGRRFVEKSGLGVHDVLLGVLDLDGEESAGADMKRERQPFDSPRRERLEQRRREVQPRRGRGDRAFLRGEDRLVVRAVARIAPARPCDVGGRGIAP